MSRYELRHLVAHLAATGAPARLHALLQLGAEEGNAWYEAKWAIDDVDGYQADLALAWRLAGEDTGLQVGYALIAASVAEVTAELPADIVAQLVLEGLISSAQAIVSLGQAPSDIRRADAIMALAPVVGERYLPELLETARSIGAGSARARAIGVLVALHPPEARPGLIAEALTALPAGSPAPIKEVEANVRWDADRWLPGFFAGLARDAATLDPGERERCHAEIVDAARAMPRGMDERDVVRQLAAIVPYLHPPRRQAVAENAVALAGSIKGIDNIERRRAALLDVLPYLPPARRTRLRAWWRFMTIDRTDDHLEVLTADARRGSSRALAAAIRRVRGIEFEAARGQAVRDLVALAEPGSPEAAELVEIAAAIEHPGRRAETLAGVIELVPPDARERVAIAVRDHLEDVENNRWPEVLAAVARHLPTEARREALASALDRLTRIDDGGMRLRTLAALAGLAGPSQVDAVLAAAPSAPTEDGAAALERLTPDLNGEQLARALAVAETLTDYAARRRRAVLGLAPRLSPVLLDRAIALVADPDGTVVGHGLVELSPYLSPAQVTVAIDAAFAIEKLDERADTAVALAERAPDAVAAAALTRLLSQCQVPGTARRLDALVAIAPRLPGALRDDALRLALEAAAEQTFYAGDARVLADLYTLLPDADRGRVLDLVRGFEHRVPRSDALEALAPRLDPERVEVAIDIAQESLSPSIKLIGSDRYSAEALARLVAHLPDERLDHAVELLRELPDQAAVDAVDGVAARLSPRQLETVFDQVRDYDDYPLKKAVAALFPHLPAALQAQALSLIEARARYAGTDTAMIAIAPHVPPALWPSALKVTDGIDESSGRAEALAAFAAHLPSDTFPALLDRIGALRRRARCLSATVSRLPPALVSRALDLAATADDAGAALAGLAPCLDAGALETALGSAHAIADPGPRATALVAIALALDHTTGRAPLAEALLSACAVSDADDRRRLLEGLVARLAKASDGLPWGDALGALARRGRHELLGDLVRLTPALTANNDTRPATAAFDAVVHCAEWWP
jgi:hypothetical protein